MKKIKNLKKIFSILIMVFLLNSCFWYKLVKEEDKKVEKKEKVVYEPWTIGYKLNKQKKKNNPEVEDEKMEETENNKEEKKFENKEEKNLKKQNKDDKKEEDNKKENIKEEKKVDFDYSNLSKIPEFWEAIVKWDWVVSKVNYNLYVTKENSKLLDDIDKENFKEFFTYHNDDETFDLTKFIRSKYNIFYWNTARTLPNNKGFTFFVVHAEGKNYIYEKHYIDLENKLHWILFLDKWPLEKADNITEKLESLKAKNKQLKEMNANFSEISTTNMVFKKLLK